MRGAAVQNPHWRKEKGKLLLTHSGCLSYYLLFETSHSLWHGSEIFCCLCSFSKTSLKSRELRSPSQTREMVHWVWISSGSGPAPVDWPGCSWVRLDKGWDHFTASVGPFVLSQVCFLIVVSRATVDSSSHHLHQHIVTFGADEILCRLLIFWLIFRKGILWLKAAYSCWMLQDLHSHHVSTLQPRTCSTEFSSAPLTYFTLSSGQSYFSQSPFNQLSH